MANTFEDLWSELKADAAKEWETIEAGATQIEHNIVPVVESDLVAALTQFKQLAITTVLNLAKSEFDVLTGQEKQSSVVTTVFQAAEAKGVQLGIADVRGFAQDVFTAVAATKPAVS